MQSTHPYIDTTSFQKSDLGHFRSSSRFCLKKNCEKEVFFSNKNYLMLTGFFFYWSKCPIEMHLWNYRLPVFVCCSQLKWDLHGILHIMVTDLIFLCSKKKFFKIVSLSEWSDSQILGWTNMASEERSPDTTSLDFFL